LNANFGELAQNIKEFIENVTKKREETLKLDSIAAMQSAIE
jgi:vacuolar protein sorting-associated protein 45